MVREVASASKDDFNTMSEEDIHAYANRVSFFRGKPDSITYYYGYIHGAEWMQEQLKSLNNKD